MKKMSTLIFLVNQINSELAESGMVSFSEPDAELVKQENFAIFTPPERSVRTILDFARSFEVTETESVGKVEWILN